MRKLNKLVLSLLLVVIMVAQVATVGYAAIIDTIAIGAINYSYDAETQTCTASVSTRGLNKQARLIIAEYDASGNVINSAISGLTAEEASETVIKVSLKVEDEANEVKAFLWDKGYEPFVKGATFGSDITANDVEIYIDGVPFEEAIGESLALDEEYIYELPITSGNFAIPEVTWSATNSHIDADVKTIADELKTVVTFKSGKRIATPEVVKHSSTNSQTGVTSYYNATRNNYEKEYVHTVTINYVLPSEGYIDNSMTALKTSAPVKFKTDNSDFNGLLGKSSVQAKYDYVMKFELPEGQEYGNISFNASQFSYQFTILVVEPLEKETKGTDAIVNADGTALTWVTDKDVVAGYDYTLTGDDRIYEPYDVSRVTWGEKASASSVAVSSATAATGTATAQKHGTNFNVLRKLQDSDYYFVNGSKIGEASRPASEMFIQYVDVPDTLLGYNYITTAGGTNQYNCTVSMTVNQDVNIHMIATANNYTVNKLNADGSVNEKVSATTLAKAYDRWMQNIKSIDAMSAAYYVVNNDLDPSTFFASSNSKTNFNYTYDGVTYGYKSLPYKIRNWKVADMVNSHSSGKGIYILPEKLKATGHTVTETDTSVTVEQKTIEEYVNLWKELEKPENLISDISLVTDNVYNGITPTWYADLKPKVTDFNGDANRGIFSDRSGYNQVRHTGMIVSYPEEYDLEDSVFITTAVKYGDGGEGDRTIYRMYGNIDGVADYTPYPLYSFTVNKDSEVLIFSNTAAHMYLDDAANGWDRTVLTEGIKYVMVSNAIASPDAAESCQYPELNILYRKVFSAGDTVTIYTPGNGASVFVPFVKPIELKRAAGLKSLRVDGVPVEGFEEDRLSYTYTITDELAETLPEVTAVADDPDSEVSITYEKDFGRASATIKVTHPTNPALTYTIDFENSGATVTDMYLCTEGNVIPKEYIAGATEDAVATNLPVYKGDALHVGSGYWADRMPPDYAYTITELDDSLVGEAAILSRVGWWNAAANVEHKAFKDNGLNNICIPWVNFTVNRPATIRILKTTNNHNDWFVDCGFTHTTRSTPYMRTVRDGGNINNAYHMYSKNVEPGELVTVPNDYESSNSYTIVIDYVDYK